jgi:transposase
MKPLSLDLRQRVVAAPHEGQTRRQVAQRFAVSPATLGRLARQWRQQGHPEPKPVPGRPRAVAAAQQETLQRLVAADKNATLASVAAAFEQETGKRVSPSALHRNLRWLEQSHKKSPP